MRKALILAIILFILFGLYLVLNYFMQPVVKAPTEIPANSDFKGPSGPPSVKGPSGPPPE